ncbi:MAG: PQQ-binding-like beta-propeller repeat protein [Bacteroidales bacterium]|nr:PQQ-binding-like beta-propeller repeat protein [Bacteroidales bacterium]
MKKTLVALFTLAAITVTAQENIQWRGTDRSGVYNETGLLKSWPAEGPTLLWSYDGLGEGHSSVAIASEKIYILGVKDSIGSIFVFDLKGKLLNKKEYGKEWIESFNGSRGSITLNDGKLYLISGVGELYCYDQQTLNLIWKKNILTEYKASNIKWGIAESPLIVGDKVIATPGGKEHNVVALNKKTGELIWSCPGEGSPSAYCSPLYIKDQQVPLIVTMTGSYIIGIDADKGTKLWSVKNENKTFVHANTPVYGDNMILCTSGYGKGSTMLRLTNGGRSVEQVWFVAELDNRIGAMVKVGNYVYGSGDNNRFWYCADWKTGAIKYKEPGLAMGTIIADDGMLYCYTDKGDMLLVKANPEKFEIVSRFKITKGTKDHWAHPVIYKGILYVRHGDSLMAYKIK